MMSACDGTRASQKAGHGSENLRVIGSRFAELKAILATCRPAALEPEITPSGHPTARASGLHLHSRYDPKEEARRAAEAISASGADTVVLLGFGLGYSAEAVVAALPEARVLAVSADPALLAACLEVRDLGALLADERLSILAGGAPEGILWALERLGTRKIRILSNKAEIELHSSWHARVLAVL
ncbi:MAG TPA: hypothetical protein VLH39_00875, partial [Magnetospirillaceae bacterium]|nr:hypothetical protein [Magnetospirillaceae bacterium]